MTAADAAAVAHLHAASWRFAYADDLTPGFLSGPVDAERGKAWTERWKEAADTPAFGWVMEDASGLLGFGRPAPEGVTYVNSWVTPDLTTCYQVMEAPDRGLLDQWMAAWADIVDFDVIPVITSAEAAARVPNDTEVTE